MAIQRRSIGFSEECLGIHIGDIHSADLGDGEGRKDEQFLGPPFLHPSPPSSYLALPRNSPPALLSHLGYMLGVPRGWKPLSGMAPARHGCLVSCVRPVSLFGRSDTNLTLGLCATQRFQGKGNHHEIIDDGYNIGRDFLVSQALRKGARVEWRDDLIAEGDEGINHGISQDGRVAILTVDYAP
ncbi:hypothetical protein FRC10_001933 [Ceratobasidium sp. 414]|nr:hypothetical protein FRC10_001933 [Ceratobasidium sp. 414]